jgi:hypothetical protein
MPQSRKVVWLCTFKVEITGSSPGCAPNKTSQPKQLSLDSFGNLL